MIVMVTIMKQATRSEFKHNIKISTTLETAKQQVCLLGMADWSRHFTTKMLLVVIKFNECIKNMCTICVNPNFTHKLFYH